MWDKVKKYRKDYLSLNLNENINYEKFSMISIVYNSTKIEGCSLSEDDTRILLESNITAKGKPLTDHLMVTDHFDAFIFIKNQALNKRKISVGFLKEVAALTMKNTGGIVKTISGEFDSSKGDLRLAQVYIDKKYFPDLKKVPALLETLCNRINEIIDVVEGVDVIKLAADLHYNLVNIHPWADGNGRVSRLMMNYIQLYHNEPLVKIFTEDRAEYISALNRTEEESNLEIFREFIALQQVKFFKAEIEKFNRKDRDFTLLF
ncbi:MAG: Fic family protein [Draconibacterium sp.]|nr:Fic family protein [Draconibacterium sp.]